MQQELKLRETDTATEQRERKDRTRFEAAITDSDRLTVELTRRTETLTAEEVRDGGETRTVIDLDEEETTTTFTVPAPDAVYASLLPGPWEVLAEALTPDVTTLPQDWDLPAVHDPATQHNEGRTHSTVTGPIRPFRSDTSTHPDPDTATVARKAVERIDEYRPELVAAPRMEATARAPFPDEVGLEAGTEDIQLQADQPDLHTSVRGRLEREAERQDGLLAAIRTENVLKAVYDPDENENGTSRRLLYEVEEEATVRETLLDLVDRGIIDATITRQPFYSPEPFEKDGEIVAGWTDAYAVVALDGMPIQMTEFSYGADMLELAEDDIASVTVEPGDMVDFAAAEVYTCGMDRETTAASRTAWEEHDTYRWFDDDWKRSIYAALAAGYRFEGSPLDLSHAPQVREAYIDAFGTAPEDAFDNVDYKE